MMNDKVSTTRNHGKTRSARTSPAQRACHEASTWIELAAERLKEGLIEALYEGKTSRRAFDTCWSSEEITQDIERALKEGAGDAGFLALGQVWLANRKAADKLRSPRFRRRRTA